jgi:arginine repressor
MAKKPAVNKSQSVRDYLKAHPGTANKEIAQALSKQGIKISANHVSNIKSKIAVSKGKRKRRSKAAKTMSTKSGVSVHEIKAAFGLLKECGGVERAKEALAAAREIQKIM